VTPGRSRAPFDDPRVTIHPLVVAVIVLADGPLIVAGHEHDREHGLQVLTALY
jgi:hypothetical protein